MGAGPRLGYNLCMTRAAHPPADSTAAAASGGSAVTSRECLIVAGIVLLSLALHVVYVLQSRSSPFFDAPQMDALYHVEWAQALAAGRDYQPGPFFRAPLYPWFLGGVFALFGEGLLLPRLIQAALGASCTLLVYLIARRVFERRAATVAALLSATYWVTLFYDAELLLEVLATPLYLLGIWLTLGLSDRQTRPRSFLAGAVWGLSAITRPNVLLFIPLLLPWLAAGRWRERRLSVLCFGLGVLLPILPLTAYNAAQGDRVLISSQAGVNLWIGNNPHSDGHTAIVPGTRPDWWGGYRDAVAAAERAEGRALRPSEVSSHYTRRALDYARSNPGAWSRQMLWKLRLFWMDWELGNNEEPRFLARRFSPLMSWLPVGFGVLAGLALAGLVASRGGGRRAFPLWGFLAVFCASVVLFFVNARFRLPVLPVLMVYAGHGVVALIDRARARRWGGLAALGAVCLIAWAGSSRVPRVLVLETEANGYLRLGQAESRAGRPAAALELYERARALYAEHAGAAPGQATGGFAAALDLAIHAAHMELGRARFEAGDVPAAQRSFEAALEHAPASFDALFSLGKCQDATGAVAAARSSFERSLAVPEPRDPAYLLEAYREAARLAHAAGELGAAVALAERMVARFPDDPRAVALLRRLRGRE